MAKPMLVMKNVTIRLPKEQIQHIKKRAKRSTPLQYVEGRPSSG